MLLHDEQALAAACSDLQDVIDIGHHAFQHRRVDDLCSDLLLQLSQTFDAAGAMLVLTTKPAHFPEFDPNFNYFLFKINDSYLTEYVSRYMDRELDPVTLKALRTSQKAFTFSQVLSVEKLEKSAVYNAFLKPQSLGYGMVLNFRSNLEGYLGTMTLFRDHDDPDFTRQDRQKAALLTPFLTVALERTKHNEKKQLPVQDLRSLGLTPREIEVLALVADGLRNKDIAANLKISVNTVETHLKSLFRKCSVNNRTSLARFISRPAAPLT